MMRRLIITGATGKQGGAVISALAARASHDFEIYAVTRDKSSRGAQKLAQLPRVKVIQGDFNNPKAIFQQVASPWGLFSVTMPLKGADIEEAQGKAMTKAAIDAGVKHIVFTATDRGGQTKSDTNKTNIPHFISKYNIEQDIMEKARESNDHLTWTFLRPVAFMENLTRDYLGKGFISMWKLNGMDDKLQLVSTTDVGKVGAEAFLGAETDVYRNKSVSLAGDELSLQEAADVFRKITGQPIPETFGIVGRGLRWALKEQLGLMFDWFKAEGFGVDVEDCRKRYPLMKDFGTWLKEESAWKQ